MANTKDYAMREMILDQCLSTGKEYTREQLQEIVNKRLAERDMMPIRSRSTILQDIQEMNEKFYQLYGSYGIVYEDRHRKRYYHYREGIESIYNRELSSEDIEKLQEVRSLLQGFRGMPQFDWLDEMSVRFDQNMMGRQREIASFESCITRDAQFFLTLFNAILHKQVITMTYRRFGLEPKQHVLHPYYLKQYRLRWYLLANIDQMEGVCVFALDRILSVKINNKVEYVDSDIDFQHYFDDIVGISHPDNGVVEHVIMKADNWLVNYLETSPIHSSQQIIRKCEDNCIVTIDVMINHELEQELLFYAEHIAVLLPVELREKLAERIRKQLKGYKDIKKKK